MSLYNTISQVLTTTLNKLTNGITNGYKSRIYAFINW